MFQNKTDKAGSRHLHYVKVHDTKPVTAVKRATLSREDVFSNTELLFKYSNSVSLLKWAGFLIISRKRSHV